MPDSSDTSTALAYVALGTVLFFVGVLIGTALGDFLRFVGQVNLAVGVLVSAARHFRTE